MKKVGKKGSFDYINAGMATFIGFVLIALLVVLLVSTTKQTSIVCPDTYDDGVCLSCPSIDDTNYTYNSTSNLCCSFNHTVTGCGAGNTTPFTESSGSAYNATKEMQDAAALPPQFGQIIVIVLIITGIVAMLALIGYGAYKKMSG